MPEFKETFSDFPANWQPHADAVARDGVLWFAPGCESTDYLVTRRTDFRNFRIAADIRIVNGAAGFVLRWHSPSEYYMVQFDIADGDDADKAWFHCFSPAYDYGLHRDIVPSAIVPVLGSWHHMQVEIVGHDFTLSLGNGRESVTECARWTDKDKRFDSGAVGFWECTGGERAEFRNLSVTEIVT